MPNQPNQQNQPVRIPFEFVLNELREENSRLSYDLAVARAQIKALQTQQDGENHEGDAKPAE